MSNLKEWVERQSGFPECLRPEDLEYCRRHRLSLLDSESQLEKIEADDAFVVWDLSAVDQDTGEKLAMLWAREGDSASLLEMSQKQLGRPLVTSSFVGQTEWSKLLAERGFYLLRHFVTKDMEPQTIDSELTMREAEAGDRGFFSALAASVVSHTLPPGRQDQASQYQRNLLRRLMRLDYGPDSDLTLLVAEDKDDRVGYLLLRLDEQKRAWVVDIGVDPNHWGKGVAQFLVLSAENQLLDDGFQYYVGEISAANSRSLYVSTKLCGFSPNRQLWRWDPT